MITLKKDNVVIGVSTEFEASHFLRSGFVRVETADEPVVKAEPTAAEVTQAEMPEVKEKAEVQPDKPKRRRRSAKQAG